MGADCYIKVKNPLSLLEGANIFPDPFNCICVRKLWRLLALSDDVVHGETGNVVDLSAEAKEKQTVPLPPEGLIPELRGRKTRSKLLARRHFMPGLLLSDDAWLKLKLSFELNEN